jgi:tetratricopeptide (TPR) repeat protein
MKARFSSPAGKASTNLIASPGAAAPPDILDRDLTDVTTSSIEAYRHYAAGIDQHQRSRFLDALQHFERAVQVDPNFALAFVKMAVVCTNIGRSNDSDTYAERALSLVGRLTPRERYYIEGFYYSTKIETTARSIAAYEKAIELYPNHSASRNNLAVIYMRMDQLDKAIDHYTVLRERGFDFPGTAGNLASAFVAQGEYNTGLAVIREFVARFPNVEAGHLFAGRMSLAANRLDEATAAFEKALELRPNFPPAELGLTEMRLANDEFERAQRAAEVLAASPLKNAQFRGLRVGAQAELYRGRTGDAQRLLSSAAGVFGNDGSNESALARAVIAEIHLAQGDREAAVAESTRAVADARGRLSALDGYLTGSMAGSPVLRSEYQRLVDALPFGSDKVLPLLADAAIAVENGRHRQALEWLQTVDAALPPGPISAGEIGIVRQPRGLMTYWRARAHLAGGDLDAAEQAFTTFVNSGFLRLSSPIEYVRAHYYLGQIAEKKRNASTAREHYARFLSYWKDGDIDRDKVAEALKKVS